MANDAIGPTDNETLPQPDFRTLFEAAPGSYLVLNADLTIVGAALGWVLHRDPDTYRYIPESIRRYPGAAGVAAMLVREGFADARVVPLLGGLMAINVARRADTIT